MADENGHGRSSDKAALNDKKGGIKTMPFILATEN
ncbi:hypothetical protein CCACVL1_00739 [Corchorus capsularis]|uniref:Uncharacterized protein n=1 Tax=Corchorus capsularis TaxID=210143 RepID=A0A1R3KV96_COCAP|nr:hypothetical protein CCACVL1_00739 [Corchorus capsularis]